MARSAPRPLFPKCASSTTTTSHSWLTISSRRAATRLQGTSTHPSSGIFILGLSTSCRSRSTHSVASRCQPVIVAFGAITSTRSASISSAAISACMLLPRPIVSARSAVLRVVSHSMPRDWKG